MGLKQAIKPLVINESGPIAPELPPEAAVPISSLTVFEFIGGGGDEACVAAETVRYPIENNRTVIENFCLLVI